MSRIKEFFQRSLLQKIMAIAFIVLFLVFMSDMLNLLLLTFVFSFLFTSLSNWSHSKLKRWLKIPYKLVILLIYGVFSIALTIVGILYLPAAGKQIINIGNQVASFKLADHKEAIPSRLYTIIEDINIGSYFEGFEHNLLETTTDVGSFLISVVMAFLLSFFFAWEKEEISKFMNKFKTSKVAFLYNYYSFFGKNFINTFGKVIQLQIMISFVNSILSVILLYFLGFNQVLGLGVMIFCLGLIPVAGVVISFVPLAIIAFQIGGWIKIVHVILMILLLHAVESYVLNPKMMSVKLKMPVFFSFSILILSEHFLGIWGLLIGIPLFMFFLDMIGVSTAKEEPEVPREVPKEAV